jgi:PKD domain/Calcineurin-like phosphoesterase
MASLFWLPETPRPAITVLLAGLLGLAACTRDRLLVPGERPQLTAVGTAPNLKVAFIGDQGHGTGALAVLRLIRDEGADMVLHQGDFDYHDNPTQWDDTITSVLGANFPYFASVGNNDASKFYGTGGYQQKLAQRLARVPGATCTGDLGVNSSCRYQGLFFVLSGAGTLGSGHEAYLRQELAADNSIWRICSWHKNQKAMQIGGKWDEVGWGPYEACRELGAIIATAHEHSYERTRTLVSTQQQTVDPTWPAAGTLRVAPGATFVFVSGLGGSGVRDQELCLPTTYPYGCNGEWASIYALNQGAKSGALFIEFYVDGDPNAARGYFKNIDGAIVDQFTITAQATAPAPNQAPRAAFTQSCGGLTCSFTDQSTDGDGTVVAWSWDFGDATTTSTTRHPSHTYAAGGTYAVTLSVTDDDGAINATSHAVTVTTPPVSMPLVGGCNPTSASRNAQLTVQVTGSDFKPGATASFGASIAVQKATFVSASRLDVRIKVNSKAPLGGRTVTVTNPDGQSGSQAGCFTVN